jgi:hypothetical protein
MPHLTRYASVGIHGVMWAPLLFRLSESGEIASLQAQIEELRRQCELTAQTARANDK